MGENQVQQGLYSQSFEHDNCGIGAVVNIKGRKDHQIVADALKIVEQLEHRAGKDAEGKTGDGVGILTQISHRFFSRVCQDIRQENVCLSFARALSKSRKILQQGWTLTESSMWYAAYLSRVTIIPMCRPYRAGPSCIRVCFWWDS